MPEINCSDLMQNINSLRDAKASFETALHESLQDRSIKAPEAQEHLQAVLEIFEDVRSIKREFQKTVYLDYEQFDEWLTEHELQGKLMDFHPNFEEYVKEIEEYYQEMYGHDFRLDRSKIKVKTKKLPLIEKALNTGKFMPLIMATPKELASEDQGQTSAQFAFHHLLEPLDPGWITISKSSGRYREAKMDLEKVLAQSVPVLPDDFDRELAKSDWQKAKEQVYKKKKNIPRVQPGSVELVFISREDPEIIVAKGQRGQEKEFFNQDGDPIIYKRMGLKNLVVNNIRTANMSEFIFLAAQALRRFGTDGMQFRFSSMRDTPEESLMALLKLKQPKPVIFESVSHIDGRGTALTWTPMDEDYNHYHWRVVI